MSATDNTLSTNELCTKFRVNPRRLVNAKYYVQLDIKGRPVAMFNRVYKDDVAQEQWLDVSEIARTKYDHEMLSREIKKLEDK